MTESKICPRCGNPILGYKAVSRFQSGLLICSSCAFTELIQETNMCDLPRKEKEFSVQRFLSHFLMKEGEMVG